MKAELALKVPGEEVSSLYYETEISAKALLQCRTTLGLASIRNTYNVLSLNPKWTMDLDLLVYAGPLQSQFWFEQIPFRL